MRSSRAVPALIVALALAGGCSSGDGSSNSTAASASAAPTPTSGTITSTIAMDTTSTGPVTAAPTVASPAPTAPPSPTGVPGIDATDELCANWARYSGSLQIIAVAANFADLTSREVAALELAAAPSIDAAVDQIAAAWPAELEAERSAALDGYLGPYDRRAVKAIDALRAAGFTDADLAAAQSAWAQVLLTHDPDQPTVEVSLPEGAQSQVAAAADAFDAAITPFVEDPSLQVSLDAVPATKAFLAAQCPDLASIGVGDDV